MLILSTCKPINYIMKRISTLNSYNTVPRKGVSWRAIFAGTITVLASMLILNLIGLAIGLGTIELTQESNPLSGLGTGALIWWIISSLVSLFAGGFVAARVGVSFMTKSGIIQGIMTWALYTLISAWLLTSAIGSIISGVGNLVGGVLSTAGNIVKEQVAPVIEDQLQDVDISLEEARNEFKSLLEDTNKEELQPDRIEERVENVASDAQTRGEQAARQPGEAAARIDEIFDNARDEFGTTFEALDREALVNVLMERTDMTRAEAERTVDNYISQYERLRERAERFMDRAGEEASKHAENVAEAVSKASWYLAIALILGLLVAGAGGFAGVVNLRDDYEATDYVVEDTDYRRDDLS
jgi:polyhydroxyalkanoate synthesis regulator phasin